MAVFMTQKDYVDYLRAVMRKLEQEKDYVTRLDAETGDGDHWANLYAGFGKVVEAADELEQMSFAELFKKIGMLLMSGVGGSSGILYGSAYLGAAKVSGQMEEMDLRGLLAVLSAMTDAIMSRGGARPGQKTMLDAIAPAVDSLQKSMEAGSDEEETLRCMKKAAADGAQSTKEMTAMLGRAVYQADKGRGHLDPGAVTMSYQLGLLADAFLRKQTDG